jgi:hypothetical protein
MQGGQGKAAASTGARAKREVCFHTRARTPVSEERSGQRSHGRSAATDVSEAVCTPSSVIAIARDRWPSI